VQITLFYIPVSNGSEANALGQQTIDHRLAACMNTFPILSRFPWEGAIQHEEEYVLILKTTLPLKEKLRHFISEHHPYKLPCIISWDVEVNDAYGKWVEENVLVS